MGFYSILLGLIGSYWIDGLYSMFRGLINAHRLTGRPSPRAAANEHNQMSSRLETRTANKKATVKKHVRVRAREPVDHFLFPFFFLVA